MLSVFLRFCVSVFNTESISSYSIQTARCATIFLSFFFFLPNLGEYLRTTLSFFSSHSFLLLSHHYPHPSPILVHYCTVIGTYTYRHRYCKQYRISLADARHLPLSTGCTRVFIPPILPSAYLLPLQAHSTYNHTYNHNILTYIHSRDAALFVCLIAPSHCCIHFLATTFFGFAWLLQKTIVVLNQDPYCYYCLCDIKASKQSKAK